MTLTRSIPVSLRRLTSPKRHKRMTRRDEVSCRTREIKNLRRERSKVSLGKRTKDITKGKSRPQIPLRQELNKDKNNVGLGPSLL